MQSVQQAARGALVRVVMMRSLLVLAGASVAAAGEYFGEDSAGVELLTTENFEEMVLESS